MFLSFKKYPYQRRLVPLGWFCCFISELTSPWDLRGNHESQLLGWGMAIINGFHGSVGGVSKCMEDGVGLSSKSATKERCGLGQVLSPLSFLTMVCWW